MAKALRLSEKWFQRGLWLVALVFAGFLIGLGGTVVGDLPRVERVLQIDDFMDPVRADAARKAIRQADKVSRDAQDALEQAQLRQRAAEADFATARESFDNWIATRRATERADQDPELLRRIATLDRLKAAERKALAAVEAQQQVALDAQQTAARAQRELTELQDAAQGALQQARRGQELRVFGYRLALLLPLLVVAGWLFVRKRHSSGWPFVWGFILFALFAFFVELVPYLPSYGGYVRYAVGIVVTVLVGRQAITALNRYRERQQATEQKSEAERRTELGYDVALTRLAKGVCPGCERGVDLKTEGMDFCPHCGIGLFNRCPACSTRKNAFSRYCHTCGAAAAAMVRPA